jgi:peptide/nickel transport system substrate-binding protein
VHANARFFTVIALAGALSVGAASCGGEADDGGTDPGAALIHGTTELPVSYDPAGASDLASQNVIFNVYENLLQIPPGGTQPEPEAAESCEFTDEKARVYECTLRGGIRFSDGSSLTSEDVKASFERNLEIGDPRGAASLYLNLESIKTPDKKTVVFELKAPDATWPFLLTSGGAAIVPAEYARDRLRPPDQVVGSGRYEVASYEPRQQTVLEANPEYTGPAPAQIERVIIRYFDDSSLLKQAVEEGAVNLAYRSLSPGDVEDLASADGVSVEQGAGAEIRYLVFNLALQDGTDQQKTAVRQAVAQVIDRDSIAEDVYNGTATPLYSMVPSGLPFHTDAFADRYGTQPSPDAAAQTLADAALDTPVPLEIWWTPSYYGPASADEYAEVQRQLEDSGLFEVTLKSAAWRRYVDEAFTGSYPVFQLGWFPDYPDADNYVSNFYSADSFLNIGYSDPEMQKLLAEQKASSDEASRQATLARIQEIGAEDAPTIPYVELSRVAVAVDGIEGVTETLDPSHIFRYWLLTQN